MVKVTLAVPGVGDVRVYSPHLSPPASEEQVLDQLDQANKILDTIARLDQPVLLLGDFNIRPTDDPSRFARDSTIRSWIADHGFVDTWTVTRSSEHGVTRPDSYGNPDGDHPDRRIDYIFASPRFDVLDGHVSLEDPNASDHLAVVTDLRVRGPGIHEAASVLAGDTGESGWAQLALDRDGRAKLTVCKNEGTDEDDGWSVQARVYKAGHDEPYRVEEDGGTSRDMCQTTSRRGHSRTGAKLETCLVKGDLAKECRKRPVFNRGEAG